MLLAKTKPKNSLSIHFNFQIYEKYFKNVHEHIKNCSRARFFLIKIKIPTSNFYKKA